MPIAHFHLVRDHYSTAQIGELLTAASRAYSQVLESPMERVRAFAHLYDPDKVAVAGELVSAGAAPAPFFTAFVLAGRPVEQRDRLLAALTDTVIEVLGADRASIRGQIIQLDPGDWGIGGVPASTTRAGEIAARASVASRS